MISKYQVRSLSSLQYSAISELKRHIAKGLYSLVKINCPLCDSRKYFTLFKNDRYGIENHTVICRRCSLVYTNPRLNDESLKSFYNSDLYRTIYSTENFDYTQRYNFDTTQKYDRYNYSGNESFFLFIKKYRIEYNSVCEIGAGGGWNLIPFMQDNKHCVGYEPSSSLVKLGNNYNINLIEGLVEDVEGTYDLVLLRHVLEHLPDPHEALKKTYEISNKYLLIEIPGIENKIPSLQNAHLIYYSKNTLIKMVSIAGFELIDIDIFPMNNFIIALFEKKVSVINFSYSYASEAFRVWKIYINDRIKFILSKYYRKIIKKK